MKKVFSLILAAMFIIVCFTAVSCSSADKGPQVSRSFVAGYELSDGTSNRVLMNLWSDGNMDIYVGTLSADGHSTDYYTGTYSFGENEEFDETITFTYGDGAGLSETVTDAVLIDSVFETPFYLNSAVTAGAVSFYETAPAETDGDVYVGYMTKSGGMGNMVYAYSLCLKEANEFSVSIMQLASVMHVWGESVGTYTVDGENLTFTYGVNSGEGDIIAENFVSEGTGYSAEELYVGFNISQTAMKASDAQFIKVK